MQLVKAVVKAIENGIKTERDIMWEAKRVRKDYGTTNYTLRRLCDHGVLRRGIDFNYKTGRYSYHYNFNMGSNDVANYIERQEEKVRKHKYDRMVKEGKIQKMQPVKWDGYYIEVNPWQPASLIADSIDEKGYEIGFDGNASAGAKYFYANGEWGCLKAGAHECVHAGGIVDVRNLSEMSLKEFIERADTRWSNEGSKKDSSYFRFGDAHTVTRNFDASLSPLTIGDGIAPDHLSCKCLILSSDYDLEVVDHHGWTLLAFKKK